MKQPWNLENFYNLAYRLQGNTIRVQLPSQGKFPDKGVLFIACKGLSVKS